jgi:hypothetical protein
MLSRGDAPRYILPPFLGWFMNVQKHLKYMKVHSRALRILDAYCACSAIPAQMASVIIFIICLHIELQYSQLFIAYFRSSFAPFRAWFPRSMLSRGDAPGYMLPPFQGWFMAVQEPGEFWNRNVAHFNKD